MTLHWPRILLTTLVLLTLATSAGAESGWYLMLPPLDARGVINLEAPLRT